MVIPRMLFLFIASTMAELSHVRMTRQPIHSSAQRDTAKKIANISFQLICFVNKVFNLSQLASSTIVIFSQLSFPTGLADITAVPDSHSNPQRALDATLSMFLMA